MMRIAVVLRSLFALGIGWLIPTLCAGHALDPSLLILEESATGQIRLFWSGNADFVTATKWDFGSDCPQLALPAIPLDSAPSSTATLSTTFECSEVGTVAGRPLRGLETIEGKPLILRYRYHGATSWQVRALVVQDGSVDLPDADTTAVDNLRRFTVLGLTHIAAGWDHLLFVSCLLLLFRSFRVLLQVITSFTVGHSVTLALCTLGILEFPSGWIESCIALSLLFMARELLLPEQRRGSIYRLPWLMTLLFGLVHGMGFAGALSEFGLPQGHFLVSLLGFNLGVELGQILFVAIALTMFFVVRKVLAVGRNRFSWPAASKAPLVLGNYAIGIVSAFWFWQRLHGSLFS